MTNPDVDELEFPAVYVAADQNSVTAQKRFLAATRLRLTFLVVASLFGGVAWLADGTDMAAVLAAVAFAGALGAELYLLTIQPDRTWYDGRAVAESAKTLTWRYVVGGAPFSIPDPGADTLLGARLTELVNDVPGAHLVPTTDTREQVTESMRSARSRSLEARRDLYLYGRVKDQQAWYSDKARWNSSRAHTWKWLLVAAEILGLVAAILKATGVISINLLGLAGAIVAAGVAWLQAKQHDTLSRAYSVAAQELAEIASLIDQPATDSEWADFVDQAEEAISREHTMWRASHA